MRLLLIFATCCTLCCCTAHNKNDKSPLLTGLQVPDTAHQFLAKQISYTNYLQKIKEEKANLQHKTINQIRAQLHNYLSQDMPAYWVGTAWDFNGTTRIPKQGNIACGYFVTTVLQDIGFAINRVKLAQQVSSVMIKLLTNNIASFSTISDVEKYVAGQPDFSVFIIGLDFHTGFIIKDKADAYFFHSNYINRQGVVMEKLQNSLALKGSKSFMVGSLSANDELLKKWLDK